MKLVIEQLPVLADNYIYLLHDPSTGSTAAVDPAVPEPVFEALERNIPNPTLALPAPSNPTTPLYRRESKRWRCSGRAACRRFRLVWTRNYTLIPSCAPIWRR